jgi:hypothetical protein
MMMLKEGEGLDMEGKMMKAHHDDKMKMGK